MTEDRNEIERLQTRLDTLVRTQIDFQKEVSFIRAELDRLRPVKKEMGPTSVGDSPQPQVASELPEAEKYSTTQSLEATPPPKSENPKLPPRSEQPFTGIGQSGTAGETTNSTSSSKGGLNSFVEEQMDAARGNLEKFIGENLISTVGIVILVLGVGIGAKFAIDNGWISPLMRIVFGYVMGFGLIGVAVRLKEKYLSFSAVLLSGGMAIMYFVTYFAYALYSLIGQPSAFGLMVIFTVFAVVAAILYNRQIIAHIGLVGAYAVPFLLTDNSGNYLFLFSYMTILNVGILAISVKKYWKSLFYTSSAFTWLIFLAWFVTKYSPAEHFYLAIVFLGIFFSIFYSTKIMHGIIWPESEDDENLICIIATALIFYGFCFAIGDVQAANREYAVFFIYLGVASLAMLLTSFRFYGRVLVYIAYPLTWLIFGAWFLTKYQADEHLVLASVAAAGFFAIFYGATLIYRLTTDDLVLTEHAGLLITNSFIFYGFGYAILQSRENLWAFQGLFTAGHAAFHSLVAHAVNKIKASAVDVVQVLAILIITFSTIAIPVQFDGNAVTMIWSVQAATLFWFGRVRAIELFEYFSYPVIALAAGSLALDWIIAFAERSYDISEANRQVFANGDFVAAIIFVGAMAFIYVTHQDDNHESVLDVDLARVFGYVVAVLGVVALYNLFRVEISNYHHLLIVNSGIFAAGTSPSLTSLAMVDDISRFNVLWQLNYTMLFATVMSLVNINKLRSVKLAKAAILLDMLCLGAYVTIGMVQFYQLRVNYMLSDADSVTGPMHIAIRYISYFLVAGLLYILFVYSRDRELAQELPEDQAAAGFDSILYLTIFITASCELVNIMEQLHIPDSTKLGLSILWAVYAVIMIVAGIAKNKAYLRIAAIVLLAATLVKLFFYDIADLPTIPKTILFVAIGILMLIVGYLYNRYKDLIFKNPDPDDLES
ncbi:hypothetical protein BH20ACI2_BH20ACI2_28990 [soil metagenome]